jgi:hypothetical protein
MTCTTHTYLLALLSMYFSTHYKNRNWNLLWEFYSFLSFKIRILDLAFNIWIYYFQQFWFMIFLIFFFFFCLTQKLLEDQSEERKIFFCLTDKEYTLHYIKRLKKAISNFDFKWTLHSFREVFLIFFCVDADRGINK